MPGPGRNERPATLSSLAPAAVHWRLPILRRIFHSESPLADVATIDGSGALELWRLAADPPLLIRPARDLDVVLDRTPTYLADFDAALRLDAGDGARCVRMQTRHASWDEDGTPLRFGSEDHVLVTRGRHRLRIRVDLLTQPERVLDTPVKVPPPRSLSEFPHVRTVSKLDLLAKKLGIAVAKGNPNAVRDAAAIIELVPEEEREAHIAQLAIVLKRCEQWSGESYPPRWKIAPSARAYPPIAMPRSYGEPGGLVAAWYEAARAKWNTSGKSPSAQPTPRPRPS